jgi:hypothetical protein
MTGSARRQYVLPGAMACSWALIAGLVLVLHGTFSIAGTAAVPASFGVPVPLDLTFTNDNSFPITVTHVLVTIRNVNAPNADQTHRCTERDYAVEQISGDIEVTVGARTKRSLSDLHVPDASWPEVSLIAGPENHGCAGASLTFNYTASRSLKLW